jgi:uncharacterized protein YcbK (DUF882 family)
MGDLSENFSRTEFACKCGCGYDDIDARVVRMCQTIRDAVGSSVRINSACRCLRRNAAAGGVKNSYHTEGLAADLSVKLGSARLYQTIKALWKDGQLPDLRYAQWYKRSNFVHIDCGKTRNNIFAESDK